MINITACKLIIDIELDITQLAGTVQYTDCIFADGYELRALMSVLGMTLNCIWWLGSSTGNLGNLEYCFIAITSRSPLIRNSSSW